MGLKKELDKLKFDKRLTGWHISRGKLKKDEFEAHLSSLPDSSDNVYREEEEIEDEYLDDETSESEASVDQNGQNGQDTF